MFTVNQLNNRYNLSEDDIRKMKTVYEAIAYSFKGPLPTEDFKALEMEHYTDERGSTQFFYLTSETGEVASVTEIVPRSGNHDNSTNLLVTMVFTNPKYRRRGLIAKLINWVINFYETGVLESDETLLLSDSIRKEECRAYVDSILPEALRASKRIHWSLYSIIGDYYKQFGFVGCEDITWLEITATALAQEDKAVQGKDFTADARTERLLTAGDLKEYFFDDEYALPKVIDEHLLNCDAEESSFPGFIERIQSYVKMHESEIENSKFFETCGILITDPHNADIKTIVFICPFFFINRIVVNRVYTSAPDISTFQHQWQRASQFVHNYAATTWTTLPCLQSVPAADKVIMLADNDFVSKNGAISKTEMVEVITKNSSWTNNGIGAVLPMIRDWTQHKEQPSRLANNGHWSFL